MGSIPSSGALAAGPSQPLEGLIICLKNICLSCKKIADKV